MSVITAALNHITTLSDIYCCQTAEDNMLLM